MKAGDYVVRGDQPFRTLADMYFSIQNYPPQNPSPYDDTGWTFQYMRDVKILPVTDKAVLDQPMTLLTADAGGTFARLSTSPTPIAMKNPDACKILAAPGFAKQDGKPTRGKKKKPPAKHKHPRNARR